MGAADLCAGAFVLVRWALTLSVLTSATAMWSQQWGYPPMLKGFDYGKGKGKGKGNGYYGAVKGLSPKPASPFQWFCCGKENCKGKWFWGHNPPTQGAVRNLKALCTATGHVLLILTLKMKKSQVLRI